MRTIKNLLWAVLPMFALVLAVSCENAGDKTDGPNVVKDATIKLQKNTVDVNLAGGDCTLLYEIENAHSGEKISAEASEKWVNNFNTSISGILYFSVDANNSDSSRQCLVTVKYRYAEDVTFIVRQGAKEMSGFSLENITVDYFSYTVDVIPENKTAPYIIMSADPTYILASGFETGEDYYEDDVLYFGWLGQWYGMTAAQVMQTRSKIGDQRGIEVGSAASGIPYTCYLYYFDYETGALLSDVALFEITTKIPDYVPATFNVKKSIDGCVVSVDVTPQGYEGAYYFDMLSVALVQDYVDSLDCIETPADAIKYYWSMAVQDMMFQGEMSGSAIVNYYNCQGTYEDGTPRSQYDFELLAETPYYLFAFAMDEHGLCCSEPTLVEITTGSVAMSDNVITPSVSKVTATTAEISFTTTNEDFYIAGWEKASDWATYGNTDAEKQQYLLKNLSYEFISGDYKQTVLGLEQGVEYVLYAFGSRGGVATTSQIWTYTFKTKSGVGAATIEFVDNGYYAAEDLAELSGWEFMAGDYYSGTFILPVEYRIEGEWQAFYGNIYDWTGRYDLFDDKQYQDGLVWHINEYGSLTLDKSYCILQNDSYYIVACMVIDTEGQYSPISKFDFTTSYDGARKDAQDFADWWNGDKEEGTELQAKTLFSKKDAKASKYSEQSFSSERRPMSNDEIRAAR